MATTAIRKAKQDVAPHWHAEAKEIQRFGTVIQDMPHYLSAGVRGQMCEKLNILLADTIVLRDMYKKHHWQVSGPTFYQLHLLFDKHYEAQSELARQDRASAFSCWAASQSPWAATPPSSPRFQLHQWAGKRCRCRSHACSRRTRSSWCSVSRSPTQPTTAGDDGTNDLAISDILRPNEVQSWFHRPAPGRNALGSEYVAWPDRTRLPAVFRLRSRFAEMESTPGSVMVVSIAAIHLRSRAVRPEQNPFPCRNIGDRARRNDDPASVCAPAGHILPASASRPQDATPRSHPKVYLPAN